MSRFIKPAWLFFAFLFNFFLLTDKNSFNFVLFIVLFVVDRSCLALTFWEDGGSASVCSWITVMGCWKSGNKNKFYLSGIMSRSLIIKEREKEREGEISEDSFFSQFWVFLHVCRINESDLFPKMMGGKECTASFFERHVHTHTRIHSGWYSLGNSHRKYTKWDGHHYRNNTATEATWLLLPVASIYTHNHTHPQTHT